MNFVRATAAALAFRLAASCSILAVSWAAQAAPVTQTTAPASSSSYGGWNWQELGSVTLAAGTNIILGLTSTVTIWDQGWGGQDPGDNQVFVGLFDNGVELWGQHVAGAYHQTTTQSFDISSMPAALQSLDTALDGIDWSTKPTVTMQMEAAPLGYPGWELFTSNASFSVASDTVPVPEPATIATFAAALMLSASAVRTHRGL